MNEWLVVGALFVVAIVAICWEPAITWAIDKLVIWRPPPPDDPDLDGLS